MAPEGSRSNEDKLHDLVKQKLEEQGYSVRSNVVLDNVEVDLLAKKEDKNSAIEVKTTKEGVLKGIQDLVKLKILPEVDYFFVAAPKDVLTEDMYTIAKYSPIGIGLISVLADNSIEFSLSSQEVEKARLTLVSYSLQSAVVLGERFNLEAYFGNPGGKVARNIKVECTPIGPFEPIDKKIKEIAELSPGNRKRVDFGFRVKEKVSPGRYFLFMKWFGSGIKNSQMVDVRIEAKDAEYIERLVTDALIELNRVTSKNIEDLIRSIDKAVEKGHINIRDHIYDKSVWNSLGMAYLKEGLLKQAELVYRAMVGTLEKYEAQHNEKIHKGLAYHNLGAVLYREGKLKEAKEMFLKAFEEDKRTYGSEGASKRQAKKALDELQFDKTS